jgi:hypothetical protein
MKTPPAGPASQPRHPAPKAAPAHDPEDEPVAYYRASTFQDMLDELPHDKAATVRKMVDDFMEKFKASKTFWRVNSPQSS